MSKPFRANQVRLGAVDILTGTADPSTSSGVAAPVGSEYLRAPTSGAYIKTGSGDTAWQAQAAALFTNVLDYGAAGDGSTDDLAAFQAAVAAVVARGGGTVFIPPGEYKLTISSGDTTSILLSGTENVRFLGCGASSVLKMGDDASGGAWSMFLVTAGAVGTEFEEIAFDQSELTNPGSGECHLIEADSAEIVKIIGCTFYGGVSGAGSYVKAGGSSVSIVQVAGCDMTDAGGACVELGGMDAGWVIDSRLLNSGTDAALAIAAGSDSITNVIIDGCYIGSAGAAADLSASGTAERVHISGSLFLGTVAIDGFDKLQFQSCEARLTASGITDPVLSVANGQYLEIQGCNVVRASTADAGLCIDLDTISRSQVTVNRWVQETTNGVLHAVDCSSLQLSANQTIAADAGSSANDCYLLEAASVVADNIQIAAEHINATSGMWLRGIHIARDGANLGNIQIVDPMMAAIATGVLFDDDSAGSSAFGGRLMVAGGSISASTAAFTVSVSTVPVVIGGNASTFGAQVFALASGSPEGVVTARVGSECRRLDGGTGTTIYIKESGTGNTGWVGK